MGSFERIGVARFWERLGRTWGFKGILEMRGTMGLYRTFGNLKAFEKKNQQSRKFS